MLICFWIFSSSPIDSSFIYWTLHYRSFTFFNNLLQNIIILMQILRSVRVTFFLSFLPLTVFWDWGVWPLLTFYREWSPSEYFPPLLELYMYSLLYIFLMLERWVIFGNSRSFFYFNFFWRANLFAYFLSNYICSLVAYLLLFFAAGSLFIFLSFSFYFPMVSFKLLCKSSSIINYRRDFGRTSG